MVNSSTIVKRLHTIAGLVGDGDLPTPGVIREAAIYAALEIERLRAEISELNFTVSVLEEECRGGIL